MINDKWLNGKLGRLKAFTLIELLVVITIIGLLATIGIASYTTALTRGRIARAQADLSSLKTAMLMYYTDVGEMPPRGDNCSACSNPPNSSWTGVIDALMSNDGSGWRGPYLDERADKDPWDHYFAYDDNTPSCCGEQTFICSVGPNGNRESFPNRTGQGALGDDICMIVMNDGIL